MKNCDALSGCYQALAAGFFGGGWMVGCETLRWPLSLRVFEPANPIFCLGTGAREQKGASTEGGMGGKQTGASGKR